MALKDIIGQDKAIGMLLGSIQRQRVATSYLFCGESGIGKKTAAINFAKALNCRETVVSSGLQVSDKNRVQGFNPETRLDACDECESCLKIAAGSHPDFLLLSPEERQIRVEEIRLIEDALSFKPYEGRKKVIIIAEADTMNLSAANAFLKTLEEPPESSIIILISSKPDRLPGTIRSRCSRINFTPLSDESCKNVLKGKIADNEIEIISRLSMGSPGLALSGSLLEEREWFKNIFEGMLNTEKDSWASREEMERWFELSIPLLRDMAVFKATGNEEMLINHDLRGYLVRISKSAELKVIIDIYNKLDMLRRLLMFNLNKSITWNYTASLLRKEISL